MSVNSNPKTDSYSEQADTNDSISTREARHRLKQTLFRALRPGENTLIDAPTSLGKSYTVATTPWRKYPEITGGELVIHIHQTRKARNEAVEESKAAEGVVSHTLKGREDCCPVAAGDYDDEFTAPNGLSPSEWFEYMCDVRKIGFGKAHAKLDGEHDLPCTEHGECQSFKQWWHELRDSDGNPTVDIVHTTANFAHVSDFIEGANLILDERPNYSLTLRDKHRQQIRDSISNLLRYRSNGERRWSHIDRASIDDEPELKQELRELLSDEISREWYFGYEETHRLAREVGLAILNAENVFDHQMTAENGEKKFFRRWKGEHGGVEVVIDGNGKLRHVHHRPDLSGARCVIGLDAFPSMYRWQLNAASTFERVDVLTSEEREYWRRNERGLKVVQVGDAIRSYTTEWDGAGENRSAGLIRALRQKHGAEFRSCISAQSIEDDVQRQMIEAGVESPTTMHYGEQNSRNDFEGEHFGLLVGSNDPGDESILDLLALNNREACPVFIEDKEGGLSRKAGRSFSGPDSDTARELLESVRETNLAQAIGRYARNPDSKDSSATVYVWSGACPDSLVDEAIIPSYLSMTEKREAMIDCIRDGLETAKQIENNTESEKSYILDCLGSFHKQGLITKEKGAGKNGATKWTWIGGQIGTIVQLDS